MIMSCRNENDKRENINKTKWSNHKLRKNNKREKIQW